MGKCFPSSLAALAASAVCGMKGRHSEAAQQDKHAPLPVQPLLCWTRGQDRIQNAEALVRGRASPQTAKDTPFLSTQLQREQSREQQVAAQCFLQKIRVDVNCCGSTSIVHKIKQISPAASPSATCVSAQGGVGRAQVSSQSRDMYRQEGCYLLNPRVSVQM